MSREDKRNMAHSVFQRLLNKAKADKVDFNLLLSRYGMERFLYRLATSPHHGRFILKGASLFLVWKGQNYRVTRDVDFLSSGDSDPRQLKEVFQAICLQECRQDDGMAYSPETVKAESIREDQEHGGVRVTLIGKLGNARIPLQIDIGFGDAITPEPENIEYPTLLDSPVPHLKAYPRYTLIAEKFETMVRLGIANSRMKDFFDIWLLSELFEFEDHVLEHAIANTFARRGSTVPHEPPFAFTPAFYDDPQKQLQWKAFTRKSKPTVEVGDFQSVVSALAGFIMPVIQKQPPNRP
ncbi:MAG: nucleotidyl transferase AbiEii/AbiGii toxin family protein [Verrucomicrobiota bacterium]